MQRVNLVSQLNDLALEGVKAYEGLKLLLVDFALNLPNKCIEVLAKALHIFLNALNSSFNLIMQLFLQFNYILSRSIETELDLILKTSRLMF